MWLKIVLLFILLTLGHAPLGFAQNSTPFSYPVLKLSKKDIQVSQESFNRYVRPQLKNMVAEYYQILKKVEPGATTFIELKNQVVELLAFWQTAYDTCLKSNCFDTIQKLYKKCREFDRTMLTLRKSRMPIENFSEEKQIDASIETTKLVDEISNINYINLHYLEELLITLNIGEENFRFKLLHKDAITLILIKSEMLMTSVLSKQYQDIFEYLYLSFIKTIESNVVGLKDREFLLKNLEEYNMAWNAFHMKMSKGGEEVPKPILQTITIMHNRWNSILKIALD